MATVSYLRYGPKLSSGRSDNTADIIIHPQTPGHMKVVIYGTLYIAKKSGKCLALKGGIRTSGGERAESFGYLV